MFSGNDFADYADEKLLMLLKAGEEKAFDCLYVRYRDKLVLTAFNRIGLKEQAEEIVQDVFMDIWNKRNDLMIRNTFASYVHTAVKYKVFDFISSLKVKDRYVQEMMKFRDTGINSTEQQMNFEEMDYLLNKSIGELPEKCREVFTLSRFEHNTVNQIAEKLNVSPDTAKYHISYALKKLRGSLRHMLMLFIYLTIN